MNFQPINSKNNDEQLGELYIIDQNENIIFFKSIILKSKEKELIPIYQSGTYQILFIQKIQDIKSIQQIVKSQDVQQLITQIFLQVWKDQTQINGIYKFLINLTQQSLKCNFIIAQIYAYLLQQILNHLLQKIHVNKDAKQQKINIQILQHLIQEFYQVEQFQVNVSQKQSIIKNQQQNTIFESPFNNIDFYQPNLQVQGINWRIKQSFQANKCFSVYSQPIIGQKYAIVPKSLLKSKVFYQQKQNQNQSGLVLMSQQEEAHNQQINIKIQYQKILDQNAIQAKNHCGAIVIQDINSNFDVLTVQGQTVYNIPIVNTKNLTNKKINSQLQNQKIQSSQKQNIILVRHVQNMFLYYKYEQKTIVGFGLIDLLGQIRSYISIRLIDQQLNYANQDCHVKQILGVAYNKDNIDQFVIVCEIIQTNGKQSMRILSFDKFQNLQDIIQFQYQNVIIDYDKLEQKVIQQLQDQKLLQVQYVNNNKICLVFELFVSVIQIDTQEISFSVVQQNSPFKMYNQTQILSVNQAQQNQKIHRKSLINGDMQYENDLTLNDQILTSVTEDSDEFITTEQTTNQISSELLNYNYVGQYIPNKQNSQFSCQLYDITRNNIQLQNPLENKIIQAQFGQIKKQGFLVIIYRTYALMLKLSSFRCQMILNYLIKFKQIAVSKAHIIFLSDSIQLALTTDSMTHFVNIGTFGELRTIFGSQKPAVSVVQHPYVLQQKNEELGIWK